MTSPRHFLLKGMAALLVATTALWAAAPGSKTALAAARAEKQSEDIVKRIDGLLSQRLRPDPLPKVLPNPFVIVSGVLTTSRDDTSAEGKSDHPTDTSSSAKPEEFPAFTSAELLARCAPLLKFGGMLQVNGRVQLVINNVPRKEGDLVTVTVGTNVVYLRVAQIMPGAVTMRLNEAEQMIPY